MPKQLLSISAKTLEKSRSIEHSCICVYTDCTHATYLSSNHNNAKESEYTTLHKWTLAVSLILWSYHLRLYGLICFITMQSNVQLSCEWAFYPSNSTFFMIVRVNRYILRSRRDQDSTDEIRRTVLSTTILGQGTRVHKYREDHSRNPQPN